MKTNKAITSTDVENIKTALDKVIATGGRELVTDEIHPEDVNILVDQLGIEYFRRGLNLEVSCYIHKFPLSGRYTAIRVHPICL